MKSRTLIHEIAVEGERVDSPHQPSAEEQFMEKLAKRSENQGEEIQIVEYQPRHQPDFKRLNEAWINQWFKMEEADYKSLDQPQQYILDAGGHILIALYQDEPVGTCALLKMDDETYELAKMSVSAQVRGKGIGLLLGRAVIEKARSLGAKRLYLESNTILQPAVSLYRKLGFEEIEGNTSPYERCDIQMELILN